MELDNINKSLSETTSEAAELVEKALARRGLRYAAVVVVAEVPNATATGPVQMGVWMNVRDEKLVPAVADILVSVVDKIDERQEPVSSPQKDGLN